MYQAGSFPALRKIPMTDLSMMAQQHTQQQQCLPAQCSQQHQEQDYTWSLSRDAAPLGRCFGTMEDEKPRCLASYGPTNRSPARFGACHERYRPIDNDNCDMLKRKLNPNRILASPRTSPRLTGDQQLPPLTIPLPTPSATILGKDRFTQTPDSVVSPRITPSPEADYRPTRTSNCPFPGDVTVSQGRNVDMEMDRDYSRKWHTAGPKRRASSPPADEFPSRGSLTRRRMSPIISEASCNSPCMTPMSLYPTPHASISRAPHQRSDTRPVVPSQLNEVSRPNDKFYICACCPRKPVKFDTQEELRGHEAERQHGCPFCTNRFKNKNEAERHRNSLHVRDISWSCKALSNYNQAFHKSTNRPGEADTCGYCGKEFSCTGPSQGLRVASEQDWEERIQHLTDVHKFRECNSNKKFYRADHFRQHLKHCHAGSNGSWTNMLENTCMIQEEKV